MPIALGGTEELKENVLTRFAKEKGLVCFCLTEPETGSDAASVRTKAVLKGDHYVLNGTNVSLRMEGWPISIPSLPPLNLVRRWRA